MNPDIETIDACRLVWPYRFDLLVRLDFLEWAESLGSQLVPDAEHLPMTGRDIRSRPELFAHAMQHPYFVHYTRLKARYRGQGLTGAAAEAAYADGMASFLRLHSSLKRHPTLEQRIALKRPLFSGCRLTNECYIGDGCHRFACLAWGRKSFRLPSSCFDIRRQFALRPLNLTKAFVRLGILSRQDVDQFRVLCVEDEKIDWVSILLWMRSIRERFATMAPSSWSEIRLTNEHFA